MVHSLAVGLVPVALFVERFGSGLINEVIVEKLDGRQGGHHGILVHGQPAAVYLMHVHAKPQSAVVDAHQAVVAKESVAHRVDKLFVSNGQELPFPNVLYRCDLGGRECDFARLFHFSMAVVDGEASHNHHCRNQHGCGCGHGQSDSQVVDGCPREALQQLFHRCGVVAWVESLAVF